MYGWYSVKHKSVWLDRFMIDQQYQGKGYAKRFLRLLIQFLQEKFECKIIYLSLHPDNKLAMGLYESFGFRLNGDIDDEGPVVGVVMELLIDEIQACENRLFIIHLSIFSFSPYLILFCNLIECS